MKTILLISASIILGSASYAQTSDPAVPSKKMPPIKMLPKNGEVKHIQELPSAMDYKIYDQKGAHVQSGNAEFIDVTKFKPGVYFLVYGDKKERFEVKKQP